MKTVKKHPLILILLMGMLSSIGFMHAAENPSWLTTFEDVIFSNVPIKNLFFSKSGKLEAVEMISFAELPLKKKSFTDFPKEIQSTIIGYIGAVIDSSDPVVSARAINSLAQVDKSLNIKINGPQFTEKLVNNFYEKFVGKTFKMPHSFLYWPLFVAKDKLVTIPSDESGRVWIAILLETEGAMEWLKKNEYFKKWVKKEQDRVAKEQAREDEAARVLAPWH